MTVTSPASALKGSRQFCLPIYCGPGNTISGTTDITKYVIGSSTLGLALGRPWKLVKMVIAGNVSDLSADATLTITAYKGSVSAGTRAMETTLNLTTVAERFSSTETETNAGVASFGATDQLIARFFYDATAAEAIVDGLQIHLFGEWES